MVREERQTKEAREERWTKVPGEKSGRDVKYGQRQSQVKSGLDKGKRAGEI